MAHCAAGRRRRLATVAAGLVAALCAPATAAALPNEPDLGAWAVEGDVFAIASHGDTTYLGGGFTYVGPRTGGAVALAESDAALRSFPEVNGTVQAVEPDGNGGWYVGGGFTHVGGVARLNVAHVLPNGSVDPAFDPGVNGSVSDIELSVDGATLFVGGNFAAIAGTPVRNVGAVQTSNGALVPGWNAQAPLGSSIRDIAVHPNSTYIYVGGTFTSMGGVALDNFAELIATTGGASGACDANVVGSVSTIELNAATNAGASKIFIGGSFTSVFGTARNGVARIPYSPCNLVDPWNPNVTAGGVTDIALSGDESTVYAVGDFNTVNGATTRNFAAAFPNDATGAVTGWNPNPSGNLSTFATEAESVAVAGSRVYVGGNFTTIGGQQRNGLAALDPATGNATGWDANLGDSAMEIEPVGSTVVAVGRFHTAKGVRRANVAALDGAGRATGWNPGVGFNTEVNALAVSPDGQTIYIGGDFDASDPVGGQPRNYLAAVNAAGAVTPWNPNPENAVNALAVSGDGSRVYVGGQFSSIGGQPHDHLAAVEASSGNATAWGPQPDGEVGSLLLKGSTLLVGGDFNLVGGATRDYAAEVSTSSGAPTAWDPSPDGAVDALGLSPDGSTVFMGGDFTNIGAAARRYIGAVSAASGAPTAFDPNSEGRVRALAVAPGGATVFAGGDFTGPTAIGGAGREYLAELDASSGAATAWNPNADGRGWALAFAGPQLLAGGEFEALGARAASGFARFADPVPPPQPPPPPPPGPSPDVERPLISGLSMTNRTFAVGRRATRVRDSQRRRRVRTGTTFRWRLSEPARTTIAIERRVAGLRLGRRCRVATRSVKRRVARQLARKVRRRKGRARARRLRALKKRRTCAAYKRRGTLTRNGKAGRNSLAFSGRIGRRALKPGRYRATFRATDAAGNRSAARRITFRVVKKPRRKPRRR